MPSQAKPAIPRASKAFKEHCASVAFDAMDRYEWCDEVKDILEKCGITREFWPPAIVIQEAELPDEGKPVKWEDLEEYDSIQDAEHDYQSNISGRSYNRIGMARSWYEVRLAEAADDAEITKRFKEAAENVLREKRRAEVAKDWPRYRIIEVGHGKVKVLKTETIPALPKPPAKKAAAKKTAAKRAPAKKAAPSKRIPKKG